MKTAKNKSILIAGTGAMASLFAARLAAAGTSVTMLGTWLEGLQALQEKGVRLVDEQGAEWVYPVKATNDPRECSGAERALVLVKSWQTARAARQLNACLSQNGVTLTLQNGLDNYPVLTAALGQDRAAAGITTAGATLLEPGRVRVGGNGKIIVGDHPRIAAMVELLGETGFSVEVVEDAQALLWDKLVINAAINPLTALLRIPNGEMLRRPTARVLMEKAAREAAAVAAALGIQLHLEDAVLAAEEVARRTESNLSSMLRDILRGSPTEIDSINGAIVRAGEKTGVPTPVNRMLWELVSAVEVGPKESDQVKKPRPAVQRARFSPESHPHRPPAYFRRFE